MDKTKIMPRSFRCSVETAEKIKGIAAEIGGNQEQVLAKLIECYEFQGAKTKVTSRTEDIEKFEALVSTLSEMYLASIENAYSATDVAKSEFRLLLNSKDKEIIALQEKAEKTQKELDKADSEKQSLLDEKLALERENEQLARNLEHERDHYQNKKAECEKLQTDNHKLTENCNGFYLEKSKLSDQIEKLQKENEFLNDMIEQSRVQTEQSQDELANIKKKYEHLKSEYKKELETEIARMIERMQLETDKKMLQLEKELKEKYETECLEQKTEKEKYKDLYIHLLEERTGK